MNPKALVSLIVAARRASIVFVMLCDGQAVSFENVHVTSVFVNQLSSSVSSQSFQTDDSRMVNSCYS